MKKFMILYGPNDGLLCVGGRLGEGVIFTEEEVLARLDDLLPVQREKAVVYEVTERTVKEETVVTRKLV